jgi:hypothetical protein
MGEEKTRLINYLTSKSSECVNKLLTCKHQKPDATGKSLPGYIWLAWDYEKGRKYCQERKACSPFLKVLFSLSGVIGN